MATFRVSNQNQLTSALRQVDGGDTVLLEEGVYGQLKMTSGWAKDFAFDSKVTIASADSSNPAIIREMFLRDAANIELKNLKLDYNGSQPYSEAFQNGRPFYAEDVTNFTVDNVEFDGNIVGGVGKGRGLRVRDGENVVIKNSEFSHFHDGLDLSGVEDVTVSNNLFTRMGNDGMSVGGLENALIENNRFTDFKASRPGANHKDGIQIRAGAVEGTSSDVTIRGNDMDVDEVIQGIYIGNELHRDGGDWFAMHRNILIEDNSIHTSQGHGIAVTHGDTITIRDNEVTHNKALGYTGYAYIPLISVSKYSTDVTITGNTVPSVQDAQNSTWTVRGNTTTRSYDHWDGQYSSGERPPSSLGVNSGNGGAGSVATGGTGAAGSGGSNPGSNPAPAPVSGGGTIVVPPSPDAGEGIVVDGAGGRGGLDEEHRIETRRMTVDTTYLVDGLDFDDDDSLLFSGFDANTFESRFGRNPVWIWNDGRAVKIDSALDLREVVQYSDDVSASTRGDLLIFRIDRGDDVAEIRLDGLGDEYRAADQPELF